MWTPRRRGQCCNVLGGVYLDMDYEGFRQMVLGANLFCVKSAELNKFSGGLLDGPT